MPSLRTLAAGAAMLVVAACSGDLTLPDGSSGGEPASLTAVAGDDQRAKVGEQLPKPLTVRVVDASRQPVAGVRVQFDFVSDPSGGTLDPAVTTTDSAGQAEATVRLGDQPGAQVIVAAVPDSPLSAQFTVRAIGKGHDGGDD